MRWKALGEPSSRLFVVKVLVRKPNFVMAEVLKHGFNQARSTHIAFLRDYNGNEVDLMMQRADQWIPIEIKLPETFRLAQLMDSST